MKNQSSTIAKTEIANVESVSTHLVTKKFIGLNYDKLSAKEQKRFRSAKRTQLFKIIDAFDIAILSKNASFDKKANFAEFTKFVKENYNLSLENVSDVFKGNGKRKESFDRYVAEYKKANADQSTKTDTKTKSKVK